MKIILYITFLVTEAYTVSTSSLRTFRCQIVEEVVDARAANTVAGYRRVFTVIVGHQVMVPGEEASQARYR